MQPFAASVSEGIANVCSANRYPGRCAPPVRIVPQRPSSATSPIQHLACSTWPCAVLGGRASGAENRNPGGRHPSRSIAREWEPADFGFLLAWRRRHANSIIVPAGNGRGSNQLQGAAHGRFEHLSDERTLRRSPNTCRDVVACRHHEPEEQCGSNCGVSPAHSASFA